MSYISETEEYIEVAKMINIMVGGDKLSEEIIINVFNDPYFKIICPDEFVFSKCVDVIRRVTDKFMVHLKYGRYYISYEPELSKCV